MLYTLDDLVKLYLSRKRFGSTQSTYVNHPGFSSLCLRVGPIYIDGDFIEAIQVVNLTAKKPGQGAFSELINHMMMTHSEFDIYVESVVTDYFAEKLSRMGFELVNEHTNMRNFLLKVRGKGK